MPGYASPPLGRPLQERMVRRFLNAFQRTHIPPGAFLSRNGYAPDVQTFERDQLPGLTERQLWQLYSAICIEYSNAEAGLANRPPFRSSDWRVMFYCVLGSRNLQEAIVRLEDVFDMADGRLGTISFVEAGNKARLVFSGNRGADPELAFLTILNGLTMYHGLLGWAIGKPLGGTAELDFPEDVRPLAEEDLLPFDLMLGCDQAALLFDRSLLQAAIVRSAEDTARLPALNPAMQMAREETPDRVTVRVRSILRARLQQQRVLLTLEQCAAASATPASTLRRQIRSQGTTFRAIRDEVRQAVAVDLLSDPNITIEDVAARLDFCDSDALRLASQKWFGCAPSEYRRSLRGDEGCA